MTLVTQIIKDAYREGNITAINEPPTAAEIEEGLRLLRRLVRSVIGFEVGDKLDPLEIGTNNFETPEFVQYSQTYLTDRSSFVPLNIRILLNLTEETQINLHPSPIDGARLSIIDASNNLSTNNFTVIGNGRKIENQTELVLSEDGFTREWLYRDDIGAWMKLFDLELADVFPFPEEFDDYFIISLAMRINPRHGNQIAPDSVLAYRRQEMMLKARYTQTIETEPEEALLRPAHIGQYGQRNGYEGVRRSTANFNRGIFRW